jgi:recombination protein RecT
MASNALAIIRDDIYGLRDRFTALAANERAFEAEAGFAIQVLQQSEYALKIALENRQSVINAVTNVAAIGVSLNPAKKQAYLVPRDGKICLDISYMGLLDLAIQSGSIRWGQAELVYDKDIFTLRGFDRAPDHDRNPFAKDRGGIVGAYVVVKTRDGDYLTSTMTLDEVYAIRDRSSAWKSFLKTKKTCPWVSDEGEMIKKTVIKRAYKMWPKTERFEKVEKAIDYLNNEGGEGLEDIQRHGTSGPGIIKGTDGAMAALSIEAQNYLRELAGEVEEMFRDPERGVSFAFDRVEIENCDSDSKTALWSILPSDLRSALKAERVLRTKAATKAEPRGPEVD